MVHWLEAYCINEAEVFAYLFSHDDSMVDPQGYGFALMMRIGSQPNAFKKSARHDGLHEDTGKTTSREISFDLFDASWLFLKCLCSRGMLRETSNQMKLQ